MSLKLPTSRQRSPPPQPQHSGSSSSSHSRKMIQAIPSFLEFPTRTTSDVEDAADGTTSAAVSQKEFEEFYMSFPCIYRFRQLNLTLTRTFSLHQTTTVVSTCLKTYSKSVNLFTVRLHSYVRKVRVLGKWMKAWLAYRQDALEQVFQHWLELDGGEKANLKTSMYKDSMRVQCRMRTNLNTIVTKFHYSEPEKLDALLSVYRKRRVTFRRKFLDWSAVFETHLREANSSLNDSVLFTKIYGNPTDLQRKLNDLLKCKPKFQFSVETVSIEELRAALPHTFRKVPSAIFTTTGTTTNTNLSSRSASPHREQKESRSPRQSPLQSPTRLTQVQGEEGSISPLLRFRSLQNMASSSPHRQRGMMEESPATTANISATAATTGEFSTPLLRFKSYHGMSTTTRQKVFDEFTARNLNTPLSPLRARDRDKDREVRPSPPPILTPIAPTTLPAMRLSSLLPRTTSTPKLTRMRSHSPSSRDVSPLPSRSGSPRGEHERERVSSSELPKLATLGSPTTTTARRNASPVIPSSTSSRGFSSEKLCYYNDFGSSSSSGSSSGTTTSRGSSGDSGGSDSGDSSTFSPSATTLKTFPKLTSFSSRDQLDLESLSIELTPQASPQGSPRVAVAEVLSPEEPPRIFLPRVPSSERSLDSYGNSGDNESTVEGMKAQNPLQKISQGFSELLLKGPLKFRFRLPKKKDNVQPSQLPTSGSQATDSSSGSSNSTSSSRSSSGSSSSGGSSGYDMSPFQVFTPTVNPTQQQQQQQHLLQSATTNNTSTTGSAKFRRFSKQ